MPPLYAAATWLFAVLLVVIFCLQAYGDWQDIQTQQITEARRSARFVTQSLVRELEEQRRMMAVFTKLHETKILDLIAHPEAEANFQSLRQSVQTFFPNAFAFTLANKFGEPRIDDFDGLVGDVCKANISFFATHGQEQPIFIHPHPEVYHYDLMVAVANHILFVSLHPDRLVRLLRENAALGQQLFLLKEDSPLIELGAEGTRLKLKRDFRLSAEEESRLLLRLPVAGTLWRLVLLPDPHFIRQQQHKILLSLSARTAGILSMTALMLWLLGRETRRRFDAENQARDLAVLSNTDALTGLPNRRALDDYLEREWHALERTLQPLTLMMVDIDHFKSFNDTQGHPKGDAALRAVAQALGQVTSRPRDMVGRFGGEEFMIILPDTPCQSSTHLAQAMHEAVRRLNIPHPASSTAPHITISIGLVCVRPHDHETPADWISHADQALYAAKQTGRNITCNYPATPSSQG